MDQNKLAESQMRVQEAAVKQQKSRNHKERE